MLSNDLTYFHCRDLGLRYNCCDLGQWFCCRYITTGAVAFSSQTHSPHKHWDALDSTTAGRTAGLAIPLMMSSQLLSQRPGMCLTPPWLVEQLGCLPG